MWLLLLSVSIAKIDCPPKFFQGSAPLLNTTRACYFGTTQIYIATVEGALTEAGCAKCPCDKNLESILTHEVCNPIRNPLIGKLSQFTEGTLIDNSSKAETEVLYPIVLRCGKIDGVLLQNTSLSLTDTLIAFLDRLPDRCALKSGRNDWTVVLAAYGRPCFGASGSPSKLSLTSTLGLSVGVLGSFTWALLNTRGFRSYSSNVNLVQSASRKSIPKNAAAKSSTGLL